MMTDNQLRDLYRLSEKELGYEAHSEITNFAERTKLTFDTSRLLPMSLKRIMELHKKHFGEK